MNSFGKRAQGERLERMRASALWNGEGFRNLHPIAPGLRDLSVPRPTLKEVSGRRRPAHTRRAIARTRPARSLEPAGAQRPAGHLAGAFHRAD
jgi:hypothetical protein